jgi:hypothetical protein
MDAIQTSNGTRQPWYMSRGYACQNRGLSMRDFEAAEHQTGIRPEYRLDGIDYFEAEQVFRIEDAIKAGVKA